MQTELKTLLIKAMILDKDAQDYCASCLKSSFFNRLHGTRSWPAAEGHRHHQEEPRGQTDHHVRLEPKRWRMSKRLSSSNLLPVMFQHFQSVWCCCRPALHGAAPLPRPVSVLRVRRRAVMSAVPALGWHGPRGAVQHCQLRSSHLHDRTHHRTQGKSTLLLSKLFFWVLCFITSRLYLFIYFDSLPSAWRLRSHSGRRSHLPQPHRTPQSTGGSGEDMSSCLHALLVDFKLNTSPSVWMCSFRGRSGLSPSWRSWDRWRVSMISAQRTLRSATTTLIPPSRCRWLCRNAR